MTKLYIKYITKFIFNYWEALLKLFYSYILKYICKKIILMGPFQVIKNISAFNKCSGSAVAAKSRSATEKCSGRYRYRYSMKNVAALPLPLLKT